MNEIRVIGKKGPVLENSLRLNAISATILNLDGSRDGFIALSLSPEKIHKQKGKMVLRTGSFSSGELARDMFEKMENLNSSRSEF